MLNTSIGIEEKCKRGLFTIISLTSGNTALPFADALAGYVQLLSQLLLGEVLPGAEILQVVGKSHRGVSSL